MNRLSKILVVFTSFCLCGTIGFAQNESSFSSQDNLDFELKRNSDLPRGFFINEQSIKDGKYNASLDSIEKHSGKLSLKIEMLKVRKKEKFGIFTGGLLPNECAGKTVEYKGWIKTQDVKNGYAGLRLGVYEKRFSLGKRTKYKEVGFDDMHDCGLKGDNDWTQVSIKMDISEKAAIINFGGEIRGEGTTWFDNLELYIDGVKYQREYASR